VTDRELYLSRLQAEFPVFQKVLQALSKDRLDYKPHERSPSAAQIMWTVAAETAACVDLVETGGIEWKLGDPPAYEEMLSVFERSWKALQEKAAALDEPGWTKKGTFRSGGKEFPGQPIGEFLWFILFDAIHHRGQLTTYIRPMGGQVPAIYGPSGDAKR
jgi:uncharacterized damage-inducible protein DinB